MGTTVARGAQPGFKPQTPGLRGMCANHFAQGTSPLANWPGRIINWGIVTGPLTATQPFKE